MSTQLKVIDSARKRELAVKASVCIPTVEKALRGDAVKGMAGHRIRAVLEAEGLLPPTTST